MDPNLPRTPELLVVTGMSGAGRSTVANALEDLGWYVVDNLPPQMLPTIADLFTKSGDQVTRLAVVIDVRGGDFFANLDEQIADLQTRSINVRTVFLDANDAMLVRRFEQVRRPHPLQGAGTLLDGITRERELLAGLRSSATILLDTSESNVHQLSTRTADLFGASTRAQLALTVMSFGFKYGIPQDADMVFDMRFLANPFWQEGLRALTGEHDAVSDFVLGDQLAIDFFMNLEPLLAAVLNGYLKENKRYATIAFGCTGGKHRSVASARALAARLAENDSVAVSIRHRDLGKE